MAASVPPTGFELDDIGESRGKSRKTCLPLPPGGAILAATAVAVCCVPKKICEFAVVENFCNYELTPFVGAGHVYFGLSSFER